jgi:hypothetical protein
MSDFAGLAAWGAIVGVIIGIVLHFNVTGGRRRSVINWCLTFGGVAVAFHTINLVREIESAPGDGLFTLGMVGFPAFVVGVLMLVLGALTNHRTRAERDASGV